MTAPVLAIEGLCSGYGGDDVVRDVSFDVDKGEILTVIGPNGSGKSSLVKTVAGLLPVRAGRIRLADRDVTKLAPPGRIGAGLAYVPQEHNVFRNMTVAENIAISTEFLLLPAGRAMQQERILERFPALKEKLGQLAGNLSGGQRQMLAFGCALMADPAVLLLDEPSAGLSPKLVDEICDLIVRTNAAGVSIVLVEQNVAASLRIAHRVLVLVGGRVRLVATTDEIRDHDDLHELFLGVR